MPFEAQNSFSYRQRGIELRFYFFICRFSMLQLFIFTVWCGLKGGLRIFFLNISHILAPLLNNYPKGLYVWNIIEIFCISTANRSPFIRKWNFVRTLLVGNSLSSLANVQKWRTFILMMVIKGPSSYGDAICWTNWYTYFRNFLRDLTTCS